MDKVTKAMTAARYALFNTHSNGKAKAVKTTAADVVWPERRDYDLYESPQHKRVALTPEQACEILDLSEIENREWKKKHLEELQAYMEEDGFDAIHSGDNICFSVDGDLSDGHHRVFAVSKTDKPVEVFCFFGTTIASQRFKDSGRSRNVADRYQMRYGKPETCSASLITNTALRLFIFNKYKGKMVAPISGPVASGFTEEEAKRLNGPGGVVERAVAFVSVQTKVVLPTPLAAALYIIIAERAFQRRQVDHFFKVLLTGLAHGPSDFSIIALRDKLDEDRQERKQKPGAKKSSNDDVPASKVINVWNAWSEGRKVGVIKGPVKGSSCSRPVLPKIGRGSKNWTPPHQG